MRVTITAKGYQGLRAEVAEILADGARVIVNRKGIDLAPRTFYFTWDAIKGGKIEMPEAPKPSNVISVKGGKVHYQSGALTGEAFPFCRTGGADSIGTFYVETNADVTCKACKVAHGD